MYRIELAPGEVTVFRTIDELATGVRNGVITARARIYHNASQKWLPIEFHPHYKLALELLAGRTIEVPSQKAMEGPRFDNIVTPPAPSQPSAPAGNLPYIALDEPPPAEEPATPSVASPPFAPPVASSPVAPAPPSASSAHLAAYEESTYEAPTYQAPTYQTSARQTSAYEPPTHEAPPTYAAPTPEAPTYGTSYGTPSYTPPSYAPPSYTSPSYDAPTYDAPAQVAPPQLAPTPLARPQFGASPVLELPKISYPEFTPTEQPMAERGSTTTRGRRPLRLAGAIVVLVAGAYAARSAYSPARAGSVATETPTPTVADRPALLRADSRNSARPVAQAALAPARPAPAAAHTQAAPPKATVPSPAIASPATSGFAAALQARAIVSGPAPALAASPPVASDSVAPIAPLPIELDLSVPSLASSDSLVTTTRPRSDSAMKRILKAVVGGKEPSPQP